jgi:hypothetical protein
MTRRIHCGVNIDPANPQGIPSAQEIQDLGATWVRFTFKDEGGGPQPSAFGTYDDVVRDLNAAGIRILMILNNETCPGKPAHEASAATWEAYIQSFATRCRQIADHYRQQVRAYQIWNESDHLDPSPKYDPRVRAGIFGPMLKSAFAAIKEVSSAIVAVGGLAAGHPSYVEQVRASTAGVLHADVVGVHPYGRRPAADWPRPDWGFGTLGDLVRQYHTVVGKPIWITELGTDDVEVQDDFPRRAFEALNEDLAEIVPHVFWFCWSDGMVSPFGLLDKDNARKDSYESFKSFATSPVEVEIGALPVVHYQSHYVLLPAGTPWTWFEACRHYFRAFRVTRGESLDDAAKVHGTLGHTITCINPTDDVLDSLRRLNPEARLDEVRADSADELEGIMKRRAEDNLRFG